MNVDLLNSISIYMGIPKYKILKECKNIDTDDLLLGACLCHVKSLAVTVKCADLGSYYLGAAQSHKKMILEKLRSNPKTWNEKVEDALQRFIDI